MTPVPQNYQVVGGPQKPSCLQKLKLGFVMGMTIGSVVGVGLGAITARGQGLRLGREFFRHTGKYALQMGGSFGVFMMVAQGIRC